MRNFKFQSCFWWAASAVPGLLLPAGAGASMPHEDYLAALKIADQYVQRHRDRAEGGGALSTAVAYSLLGKYYEVGDTWEVAAIHIDLPQMRMTSDPEKLKTSRAQVGVFRYVVRELKPGANPQVMIEISQKAVPGVPVVDPRVELVRLRTNDRLNITEKTYQFVDRPGLPVSPEGVRLPNISALELFPLDVPDAQTAERKDSPAASVMPELPEGLHDLAVQAGWAPDLSRSVWFEQDDFFGRPVRFLWVKGDPWPSYIKTSHGVAILLRKGTQ